MHTMSERKIKTICITGDVCSGKSLFASLLAKQMKTQLIKVDEIVKELYLKKQKGYKIIKKYFGKEYVSKTEVNKGLLLQKLLSGEVSLEKIDKHLQPVIKKKILKLLMEQNFSQYVVFEMGSFKNHSDYFREIFDFVILVNCNEQTKVDRLSKRNNISKEKSKQIINFFSNPSFNDFDVEILSEQPIQKSLESVKDAIERKN